MICIESSTDMHIKKRGVNDFGPQTRVRDAQVQNDNLKTFAHSEHITTDLSDFF